MFYGREAYGMEAYGTPQTINTFLVITETNIRHSNLHERTADNFNAADERDQFVFLLLVQNQSRYIPS